MNRLRNTILFTLGLTVSLFYHASIVHAYTSPSFPSCVNPSGTIVADYGSGQHGIAGQADVVEGADTVYKIADNGWTQCFCPSNGEAIQTDWWKASDLSTDEIDVLKSEGWIYIPNGSAWGLEDCPYLAKNISYSCQSSNSGGSSSSSSSSSSSPAVQAASAVESLAFTGNIVFVYTIGVLGTISTLLGLVLLKTKKTS